MPVIYINNDDIRLNSSSSDKVVVTGSLGIGTTAPIEQLQLTGKQFVQGGVQAWNTTTQGTTRGSIHIGAASATANAGGAITFGARDSSSGVGAQAGIYTNTDGAYGTRMYFSTSNSYSTGAQTRMTILENGNIGVGTTGPGAKLDVNGEIFASSNVQIGAAGLAGRYYIRRPSDGSASTYFGYTSADNTDFGVYNGSGGGNIKFNSNNGIFQFNNLATGELVRITSAGNVGIGTTAPTVPLQIVNTNATISMTNSSAFAVDTGSRIFLGGKYSSATSNNTSAFAWLIGAKENATDGNQAGYLSFTTTENGGGFAERMRITSTGNVGIGTTAPTSKLFVLGTGTYNTSTSEILASDVTIFSSEMSNDAYNSILQLVSVRQSLTTGNASNGFLGFSTIDDSNAQGVRDAGRIAIVNEVGSSRNSATALSFWTNAGGTNTTAATEKVRITSGGNVGIGTTSPTEKLHVVGNAKVEGSIGVTNIVTNYVVKFNGSILDDSIIYDNGTNVGIGTTSPATKLHVAGTSETSLRVSDSGGSYMELYQQATDSYILASNALRFYNGGSERVRITSAGNVGIGTTAPSYILDVSGTARATTFLVTNATNTTGLYITSNAGASAGAIIRIDKAAADRQSYVSFDADQLYFGIPASNTTLGEVGTKGSVDLRFATAYSERMRITAAGNVGIGTASPSTKLHVNGGSIFNQDGFLYMSNQFPIVWGAAVSIEGDNVAGTLTLKTESSHRIFINNVGNVGINTTAPQQLLHVLGATNGYMMVQGANDAGQAGIYFKKEDTTGTMNRTKGLIVFHTNVGSGFGRGHLGFCLNSADSNAIVSVSDEKFRMVDNGDFLADGDVVAYSTTISDERYKTNITPIESALDKVNQMRGVSFDWTAVRSGREFGVIAQEIEKIAPEVVSEKELLNGETMKTVSYTSLVPFLIESIKELTARVEELEQKLKQ